MGSLMGFITNPAEHAQKQGHIDALRITQAANNKAQISVAESKRIVQTANNAASDIYTANLNRVQSANNAGATAIAAGRTLVRDTGNTVNKELADAQRRVQGVFNEQAIVVNEAKRTLQAARNERSASDASIGLWEQSLKNQRIMDEAGTQIGRVTNDAMMTMQRASTGKIMDRIQASQMAGAAVAQAAFLGVGGSSVNALKDVLSMRQALDEGQRDAELHSAVVNKYRERGDILASAVGSLDYTPIVAQMDREALVAQQDNTYIGDNQDVSPIFADIDYSVHTAQHDYQVFTPDIDYTVYQDDKKMSNLQKYFTFNTAAVATYFGGPQAGAAVLDASMGMYKASNGDYAGAQQMFSGALKEGMGGFNTYRAGASGDSSGQAWGASIFSSGKAAASTSGYSSSSLGSVNYGASLHL